MNHSHRDAEHVVAFRSLQKTGEDGPGRARDSAASTLIPVAEMFHTSTRADGPPSGESSRHTAPIAGWRRGAIRRSDGEDGTSAGGGAIGADIDGGLSWCPPIIPPRGTSPQV